MSFYKSIRKYLLWIVLSIPGLGMLAGIFNGRATYDILMHATGEFSARFLIISLIATPIALMFPKSGVASWLVSNRRYFGLAAFAYALAHTVFYLNEIAFEQVKSEFFEIGVLTGWIAFFIFVPLAITSNDASVRKLKAAWKKLQRWVYLAAIMTLLHWALIHYNWKPAMVHFAPVILLQIYRVWKERQLKLQKQ